MNGISNGMVMENVTQLGKQKMEKVNSYSHNNSNNTSSNASINHKKATHFYIWWGGIYQIRKNI